MEATGAGSAPEGEARLFEDPDHRPPGWAYLHKAITVMTLGCLASVTGGLLFLLRRVGVMEASASVASSCVSMGLMLLVMGLVWIPILKEKQRRKRYSQGGNDLSQSQADDSWWNIITYEFHITIYMIFKLSTCVSAQYLTSEKFSTKWFTYICSLTIRWITCASIFINKTKIL